MKPLLPISLLCLLLSGCGSDGNDIIPTANISNVNVTEGDAGQKNMVFTLELNGFLDDNQPNATVNYTFQDGTAVSTGKHADYTATPGSVTFQFGGATTHTFAVPINGDAFAEEDETFAVNFSVVGTLLLGSTSVTAVILNDDGNRLNDTGMIQCADGANNLACPVTNFPSQDAQMGRDAAAAVANLSKLGGGNAGFDFTKLAADGQPIAIQTDTYSTTPWDCVKDYTTGMMWEVKQTNGSGTLRDNAWTYSWYNPNAATNGGVAGTANGGICNTALSNCDSQDFVVKVNATGLCGFNDWRLPTPGELQSLVDYSAAGPTIDTNYFPHTVQARYWSATTLVVEARNAWFVNLSNGDISFSQAGKIAYGTGLDSVPAAQYSVRLVRGGL